MDSRTALLLDQVTPLRKLARALLGDRPEVDDLVQDTLVLALERETVEPASLGAWLGGVLRRKASHLRRDSSAREQRERHGSRAESLPATDQLVARKAQLAALVEELLNLPEPYQSALYLRFFEGKGPRKVSLELGTKEGTVASQVHRGLELLRQRLDERTGGDRSTWVNALTPWFAGSGTELLPPWKVMIMTGKLKLAAAATVLGALLFYTFEQEPVTNRNSGLRPEGGQAREELAIVGLDALASTPRAVTRAELEPPTSETDAQQEQEIEPPPSKDQQDLQRLKDLGYAGEPDTPSTPLDAGTEVQRRFTITYTYEPTPDQPVMEYLGDGSMRLNMNGHHDQVIEATDRYQVADQSEAPGPASMQPFERVLTASWTSTFPKDAQANFEELKTTKGRSPFSSRAIQFRWSPLQSNYVATFGETQPDDDPAWLLGLVADMDLRGLAPRTNGAPGSRQDVLVSSLRPILAPGGDLRLLRSGESSPMRTDAPVAALLFDDAREAGQEDVCIRTTESRSQVAGRSIEAFKFLCKVSRTLDVQEFYKRNGLVNLPANQDISGSLTTTLALQGHGKWDVEAQRVAQLDLSGTLGMITTIEGSGIESTKVRIDCKVEISVSNVERRAGQAEAPRPTR